MPMQEFLASYAVQVDEDGARRLQAILDKNRESGAELAAVFASARSALIALKKELSDTSGLKNILSGLMSGAAAGPRLSSAALASLTGSPGLFGDLSTASASSLSVSASAGPSRFAVGADFSAAEEALSSFHSRLEAERPRLSVNASGISSAVSSAIASIRAMLSSVRITVPVTAVPTLDTTNLPGPDKAPASADPGPAASAGGHPPVQTFGIGGRVADPTLALIAEQGSPEYIIPTDDDARAVPLLQSVLAELSASARRAVWENAAGLLPLPDLEIPLPSFANPSSSSIAPGDTFSQLPRDGTSSTLLADSIAVNAFPSESAPEGASLLSEFKASLADVIASARTGLLPAGSAAAAAPAASIQAPVNIHVTASSASPEAVGRSIYDTAQRSLLKTLRGVFI